MVDPTSEIMGKNLRRIRQQKGVSIETLALQVEAAGYPMTWKVLSRTERGLRKATVGDLMAIACNLEVSPLELLLPDGGDAEIQGFGTAPASAIRDWVSAGGPLEDYLDAHQVIYT